MREVKRPQVHLVARTQFLHGNFMTYLKAIGSPNYEPGTDPEELVQSAGRLCYKSWQPWDPEKPDCSNPNVSKVREGIGSYIYNILESGHGSVLEHVTATFILQDISRVLTHELVRHRVGIAFSQESLRYCRLQDLKFFLPPSVQTNPKLVDKFRVAVGVLELIQEELHQITDIENCKSFAEKKKLTSMFRRLAPIGLATTIMFTANLRALRHMISQRTSGAAEEEIRQVFLEIAKICNDEFPASFQDMTITENGVCDFEFEKV